VRAIRLPAPFAVRVLRGILDDQPALLVHDLIGLLGIADLMASEDVRNNLAG
jgi:hypothetical protein